jgi:predicted transcriptional regulator
VTHSKSEPAAMTTVAAQMSAKLRNRLEAIAREDDRKLSYVIRKACEEYAERHETERAA